MMTPRYYYEVSILDNRLLGIDLPADRNLAEKEVCPDHMNGFWASYATMIPTTVGVHGYVLLPVHHGFSNQYAYSFDVYICAIRDDILIPYWTLLDLVRKQTSNSLMCLPRMCWWNFQALAKRPKQPLTCSCKF